MKFNKFYDLEKCFMIITMFNESIPVTTNRLRVLRKCSPHDDCFKRLF